MAGAVNGRDRSLRRGEPERVGQGRGVLPRVSERQKKTSAIGCLSGHPDQLQEEGGRPTGRMLRSNGGSARVTDRQTAQLNAGFQGNRRTRERLGPSPAGSASQKRVLGTGGHTLRSVGGCHREDVRYRARCYAEQVQGHGRGLARVGPWRLDESGPVTYARSRKMGYRRGGGLEIKAC